VLHTHNANRVVVFKRWGDRQEFLASQRSTFKEGRMGRYVVVGAVVVMILSQQVGTLRGDPPRETEAERIARLIKQLGDDSFAKRRVASKELKSIGAVLTALKQAAFASDELG
jgi:hypothetical protein